MSKNSFQYFLSATMSYSDRFYCVYVTLPGILIHYYWYDFLETQIHDWFK